jgi:two-component system, NtrC family, sensor kinase
MKKIIPTVFLFYNLIILSLGAFTQNRAIDSLKAILQAQKNDTRTANTLNELASSFLNIDNCDSGIYYSLQAVNMSEGLSYKTGIATAKFYTGVSLRCKKDYTKAYIVFLESKQRFLELDNELYVSKCFRNIGSLFLDQGNSTDALENYFSALNLAEKIKDTAESMKILGKISFLFYSNEKYEKALEYARKYETYAYNQKDLHPKDIITEQLGYIYKELKNDSMSKYYEMESLRLSELQKDTFGIANSYIQLSDYYASIPKYEEAISYLLKAEEMYRIVKDSSGISNSFFKRGNVYLAGNKTDLALQSYFKSLHLDELQKDSGGIADNYSKIGNVYFKMEQYVKALNYFQTHLIIYESLKEPLKINLAYENLSKVYEKLNMPAEAMSYFKKYIHLKDSIDKKNQAGNLIGIEAKINFEKVVQENKAQQEKDKFKARIKIYSLIAGLAFLLLLTALLYRNNKQKQKAKTKIETAFEELKSTQVQLIQSEKMASLGELTAGIAHEIQNPLNFVNNFSEVNKELLVEMKEEIDKGNLDEIKAIANDIIENEQKINHHGKRADAIVKGMLQHSRSSSGVKEPTDINKVADEYLRLAYHGMRAKDKSFNVRLKTEFDATTGNINIIPQDIGRVLLNLYNNAFYAVGEKKKQQGESYEPTVSVYTKKVNGKGLISVKDNGNGIPQKILDKIFQPFFTTKPTGQGTGLGLSLSYDIVKAHGGELKVESKEGEGAEFIIQLPVEDKNLFHMTL